MALGRNQLIVLGSVIVVAIGYQVSLNVSDNKVTNLFEERKAQVTARLEEARKAQQAREASMANQTGMENLNAVTASNATPSGRPDARAAAGALSGKIAESAAAADAALSGKGSPQAKSVAKSAGGAATGAPAAAAAPPGSGSEASESAVKPKDPGQTRAENDNLMALVGGIRMQEKVPETPPKTSKLALVDPEMASPTILKRQGESSGRTVPKRIAKMPSREALLAELKRDAPLGLGLFAEKWAGKYGSACWSELAAFAGTSTLDMGLRYFSLQAALEIGGQDSAEGIASLLTDTNPGIRCLSLLGLGELGNPDVAEKVSLLLEDRAMVVRECALTAVVRMRGSEAQGQVLAVIANPRNYVKGRPLSIVKRGFDLLDAMGSNSTSQEGACKALHDRMPAALFTTTAQKWSICSQPGN